MEVNGYRLARIFFEKSRDCCRDLFLRHGGRKLLHRAVLIVLDFQGIEKIAKHLLVGAEQPGLEEMGAQRIAQGTAKRRLHPRVTLPRWFSFDENPAEIPLIGQPLDRRLVYR